MRYMVNIRTRCGRVHSVGAYLPIPRFYRPSCQEEAEKKSFITGADVEASPQAEFQKQCAFALVTIGVAFVRLPRFFLSTQLLPV